MTEHEQRRLILMPLVRLALENVDSLPPPERADIYEGIALVLAPYDHRASSEAQKTCEAIRAAESQQLSFQRLFTDAA